LTGGGAGVSNRGCGIPGRGRTEVAWEGGRRASMSASTTTLLAQAASGSSLTSAERDLLGCDIAPFAGRRAPAERPTGLDDVAPGGGPAPRAVVGIDYSQGGCPLPRSAARTSWPRPCRYVVAAVPAVAARRGARRGTWSTPGKAPPDVGLPDLADWARGDRAPAPPAGALFVYEEHPAAVLVDLGRGTSRGSAKTVATSAAAATSTTRSPARGAVAVAVGPSARSSPL